MKKHVSGCNVCGEIGRVRWNGQSVWHVTTFDLLNENTYTFDEILYEFDS